MFININVKLLNLLLSLSDALDLASPDLSQHQLRTGFIAWQISKAMGLSKDNEINVFIAALLHDVGALALEDKIDIIKGNTEDNKIHCQFGQKLLSRVPMFEIPAAIVKYHHEPWISNDLISDNLILFSQILYLADTVERAIDRNKFILHQHEQIIESLSKIVHEKISTDVYESFLSITHREDFWFDLTSSRLYSILLNNGPGKDIEIDLSHLLTISKMFRDLIDFRSRFTSTHSSGVSAAAAALSRLFGFTTNEVEMMEVAGNLHDLGKLVIPNSILNKPGKLTKDEYAIMRQHTYYTYSILTTIGGIHHIAGWAAFHHERLDGSGYPFHLTEKQLDIKSRIMAVSDVFTALTEDRPYRAPLKQDKIMEILTDNANKNWLDKNIVHLLKTNYEEVETITKIKQARSREFYEREFLPNELKITQKLKRTERLISRA